MLAIYDYYGFEVKWKMKVFFEKPYSLKANKNISFEQNRLPMNYIKEFHQPDWDLQDSSGDQQ